MSGYDFDTPVERRGTDSIKWSRGESDGRWAPDGDVSGAPQDASLLPMWLSDMDFAAAPEIVAALEQRVKHGVYGYTHRSSAFDAAVIDWTTRRHGWTPEAESIFVNSGVMPSINLAVQAFSDPGDGVIVQPPVFHPIPEAAEFNGRRAIRSPLIESSGRYRMDFDDLADKAADPATKMWILCSPHNPVGRVWNRGELGTVIDICRENDVLLVSDEIHADLAYPSSAFTSVGGAVVPGFDNFVVCGGPSKAFNLPGLKLSTTIIPEPELRSRYETAMRNLNELWGISALGATALVAAYTQSEAWLDALLAYLERNLQFMQQYILKQIPKLRFMTPDSLYLAWIDCRQLGLPGAELTSLLRDAGVWVENGATYGSEGEGFIRLTYATPRVILQQGLERVHAALGDL